MPVKIIFRDTEIEIAAPITVRDALFQINLPPEHYLVVRDGQLLDEDDVLQDGNTIRLVGVISGGRCAKPTSAR